MPDECVPIELGLVDDHSMYRDGAALWLENQPGRRIRVVAAVRSVADLLVGGRLPAVVLLDPSADPVQAVSRLVAAGVGVIVHSTDETPHVVRAALAAGARGYVSKRAPLSDLVDAVVSVAGGGHYLTRLLAQGALLSVPLRRPVLSDREVEVLRGVAEGRTRLAVARSLGLSEGTVKTYLERIRCKYRAAGRAAGSTVELYQRALEDGLIATTRVA
ncbi:DNA-binding NarL/FixJ family response regulator [Saccharothrix ecbatanensis]|uniref:DNA-binding NarL/FixJ family response regulator n=1 Tax=Saccharothrix ecbatanensis TaxID=1105145 RepID=A0A7W9M5G2_9PSEU|nr:response regulator transcription factor [Saccharothrix ecbatanensis]MBB5808167.1 DNA-binding NarL/FixJ family response regulator [Saccharothrix ecbatanensis]